MSDDWAPGDLALCIKAIFHPEWRGRIFTVRETVMGTWQGNPTLGLRFKEVPDPSHGCQAWDHRFYRKIYPHTPDEFDREVIELMTSQPVHEPV